MKKLRFLILILFIGLILAGVIYAGYTYGPDGFNRLFHTENAPISDKPKVLIIGLDGGTWRVLMPLAEEGVIPNIKRILDEGCYGRLHSERAYSAPSWTTIYTGMSHKKHNIMEFTIGNEFQVKKYDREGISSETNYRFNNSSVHRESPALWEILSNAGYKVGTVGNVLSYPAEKVNGFNITGDGSPFELHERTPNFNGAMTEAKDWQNVPQSFSKPMEHLGDFYGEQVYCLAIDTIDDGKVNYDNVYIASEKDASKALTVVKGDESIWLEMPFDGIASQIMSTETDCVPEAREPVVWDAMPESYSQPWEVTFVSDITPVQHGKKLNQPLFFMLIDTTDDNEVNYDSVKVSYIKKRAKLTDRIHLFGLEITPTLQVADTGSIDSFSPLLDLQLKATFGKAPFHLYISDTTDDETVNYDRVHLSNGVETRDVAQHSCLDLYFDWVIATRKATGKHRWGLPGWVTAQTRFARPERLSLQFGRSVYQSFSFPLFNTSYPEHIYKGLDPKPLLEGYHPILRHQNFKGEVASRLIAQEDWDLFMVTFTKIDLVQHGPWNDPDPTHLDLNDFDEVIRKSWHELDTYVGKIIDAAPDDTYVFFCSDHGFNPIYDRRRLIFALNEILKRTDWLTVEEKSKALPVRGYDPTRKCYNVTYYWQALDEMDTNYSSRLKILTEDNRHVEMERHWMGQGAFPPVMWKKGEVVKATYQTFLPHDIEPGNYKFTVEVSGLPGAIDATGQRVKEFASVTVPEREIENPLCLPVAWNRISQVKVYDAVPTEELVAGQWDVRDVTYGNKLKLLAFRVEEVESPYKHWGNAEKHAVNWKKTKAYCYDRVGLFSSPPYAEWRTPGVGFYLNYGERSDSPAISSTEVSKAQDDLYNFLRTWRIKETSEPFFTRLQKNNRFAMDQPDIRYSVNPKLTGEVERVDLIDHATYDARLHVEYMLHGKWESVPLSSLMTNQIQGGHGKHGILAIRGPGIVKKGKIDVTKERDIAPTVLALFGVEPEEEMDGAIIKEPFGDFFDKKPEKEKEKYVADAGEEEDIGDQERFEKLKALGYIGGMQKHAEKVMAREKETDGKKPKKNPKKVDSAFVGGMGDLPCQFNQPRGLAVDKDNLLYVVDFRNNRVQKMTMDGKFILEWGTKGEGPGQFRDPTGIAISPEGLVYVADTWNHRIQIFDREGKYIDQISKADMGFFAPKALAFHPQTKELFVVDTGNAKIKVIGPDKKEVRQWGKRGPGQEDLREPCGIAFNSKGDCYIADVGNKRIQVFDKEGKWIKSFPVEGFEGKGINEPFLAFDSRDVLYFTIPTQGEVRVLHAENRIEMLKAAASVELNRPTAILVYNDKKVIVSDTYHHKLREFDL